MAIEEEQENWEITVSAYNSLEAFRLHYSWQVPGYHAGTTDGCACISPFSGINCTRLYNNHLPECLHILSGQFPVSHGIVFRIRRLFPDLVRVAAGIHFGSGPFPAPVHPNLKRMVLKGPQTFQLNLYDFFAIFWN